MRLLKNRKAAQGYGEVSGTSVNFPIKYQKSTQGGWYSGLTERLSPLKLLKVLLHIDNLCWI